MAENVVEVYYNRIMHLRSAEHFLNDIFLINQTLMNFDYATAEEVISYIAIKYKKDLNQFGKMMTGVMVFKRNQLPEKTEVDVERDLYYLRDCIIIFAAVHTGVENTLHSAVVKINRAREEMRLEQSVEEFDEDEDFEDETYDDEQFLETDGREVYA